jgi:hypothetical protein
VLGDGGDNEDDDDKVVKLQLRYIFRRITSYMGYAVAYLVEALCHKPEGRGFGF